LNQLILKLVDSTSYDSKFMKTFIITYQSIISPWVFFRKLRELFNTSPKIPKEKGIHIQFRVIVILKHWVENQLDDLDDDLILNVDQFISELESQEQFSKLANSLKNYLEEKIQMRSARLSLWFQEPAPYNISVFSWPDLMLEVVSTSSR